MVAARRVMLLKPGVTSSRHLLGDYEHWFSTRTGARFEPIELHAGVRAPSLEGFDAVVMSGSPLSVTELQVPAPPPSLDWMARAADLLLEASAKRPVLGVCFGHQLLAWRLGATVRRNPRGKELGTAEVSLTPAGLASPLYRGLPSTLRVQQVHEDEVEALPVGAVLQATNAWSTVQAFGLGERLWAVQFHPEMDAASTGYCAAQDPTTRALPVAESDDGATLLRNFLELA